MSGSSLRNAVHRRNHKERSQPVGRSKLGLLEKHKDYVLRAKDHHRKAAQIKRLTEKAAMRNKDEFYFGMINSSTKKGVHQHARPGDSLDNDVVALLRTQDVGYVRRTIVGERKRVRGLVERLAPAVGGLGAEWVDAKAGRRETLERAGLLNVGKGKGSGTTGKKTVWLDDADALRAYNAPSASQAPQTEESWIDDLSDTSDIEDDDSPIPSTTSTSSKGAKHYGYLVTELQSRYARLDQLQSAAEKLDLVRALMTHKGGRSQVVKQKKKDSLTDAVAKGKVTKNGLALVDTDDEDEDGEKKGKVAKVYKFGKERKR
ncbi:Small-subunit processome, Utp11 [Kalmanozyma brasiliensis GHG001]|uniref:U3 small nucleolar RNA-associated protein 11 n=1 Tax=Kalmanozyma brasiliensis (strain GHG001) TaxID=1365824 RepID=V5GL25_KALBG|nr:Small-subunit processome, Utp11 [Kalmanozyma brasiliensis GHG001]EST06657.1 Small-subunit processome, Utp11 [Kalmanozyma brasiliensis GHG001]